MTSKENFIRAVLVVFWLLFLSRIPAFISGTTDGIIIVSTLVEVGFFVWGLVILKQRVRQ
jgi:hypothetical protein